VQPVVASFTRVCAYDRAGCGLSDPGPKPRTSGQIADELHILLHNAGIDGPYVLVGHSSGGMNMRVYAGRYPDEVAGLVLVDAAPEGQRHRWPHRSIQARLIDWTRWQSMRLYPVWARLGIMRLRQRPNGDGGISQDLQPLARSVGLRSRAYDWIITEAPALKQSEEQVRAAGPLGVLPLMVISAHLSGAPSGVTLDEARHICMDMQVELTRLSTNSTHTIAEESGHMIPLDQPHEVIDAIRRIVDTVRQS